jgi:hypothetical protein
MVNGLLYSETCPMQLASPIFTPGRKSHGVNGLNTPSTEDRVATIDRFRSLRSTSLQEFTTIILSTLFEVVKLSCVGQRKAVSKMCSEWLCNVSLSL